jgi:DNA adenine methylase
MIEPFVGSGAVTLAAACRKLCTDFMVGDALGPLCGIWERIVSDPGSLASEYSDIWHRQFPDPVLFFNDVREKFNRDKSPSKLLFLLARCVKNAVRFNPSGQFNQSADKRRLGTHPKTMAAEIHAAHRVLQDKCEVRCGDYKTALQTATANDIVYMDPPYQGTSEGRDSRYIKGVERGDLISALEDLNQRGVQFILSYDGSCGDKTYGEELPDHLRMRRILVDAGRSSQATLNGKDAHTLESIYISSGLAASAAVPPLVSRDFMQEQNVLFGRV